MLNETLWGPIVRAAVDEYLNKKTSGKPAPIPAAPLKPLVIRHAQSSGQSFPPAGFEQLKFVDFLDLFPQVVLTRRRPGQDTLVVRSEDSGLLDEAAPVSTATVQERPSLRSDVFAAFTKVLPNDKQFWYLRASDEFVDVKPDGLIERDVTPVPKISLDDAIAERQQFLASCADTSSQNKLGNALKGSMPLRSFSQVVKELSLEHQWHLFRLDNVFRRIQTWTQDARIDWSTSWQNRSHAKEEVPKTITSRETNAFLSGLMQLGPEDAKRILVPLDIVLKLAQRG